MLAVRLHLWRWVLVLLFSNRGSWQVNSVLTKATESFGSINQIL